jgi:predicted cupin superfamily sugar epimerase
LTRNWIADLHLSPHPEGGHYRQVFKSKRRVDGDSRSALTAIYFVLGRGERSRWHRVRSDEIWVHLDGAGVSFFTFDGTIVRESLLDAATHMQIVEANVWQAAEATDGDALFACFVAPGFEFEDFSLMSDEPESRDALLLVSAEMGRLI